MQNDFGNIIVFLIFIVIGLASIYRPTLEWLIKFGNSLRGVKTEISGLTIIYYRITGTILLIIGVFYLFIYLLK